MLRFWRATINSRNGLAFAIRSEQAIREELVALALSLPFAWLIGVTMMRRFELVAAVVLVLVEILHTVRISIRSHTLVTEPFLVVGLIATIRRMLVITLDAANLTDPANWANDGQAKLRSSMLELALLGGTVIVLVISIHILRKSKSPEEEEELRRVEGRESAQPG